ncbi:MAG: hypothetical protein ACI8RN_002442 [Glaciecola sp.]|jgi:hypothetical protein
MDRFASAANFAAAPGVVLGTSAMRTSELLVQAIINMATVKIENKRTTNDLSKI